MVMIVKSIAVPKQELTSNSGLYVIYWNLYEFREVIQNAHSYPKISECAPITKKP